jgi:hypothetical protein
MVRVRQPHMALRRGIAAVTVALAVLSGIVGVHRVLAQVPSAETMLVRVDQSRCIRQGRTVRMRVSGLSSDTDVTALTSLGPRSKSAKADSSGTAIVSVRAPLRPVLRGRKHVAAVNVIVSGTNSVGDAQGVWTSFVMGRAADCRRLNAYP